MNESTLTTCHPSRPAPVAATPEVLAEEHLAHRILIATVIEPFPEQRYSRRLWRVQC